MLVQASVDLSIDLVIVPIKRLLPHEQTIPSLLESVIRDLERTGFQRDPILVDSKTMLVLDGMHRRAALEAVGCRYALCSAYDYLLDSTILQRWLRFFIAPDRKFIEELVQLFDLERVDNYRTAAQMVDSRRKPIALLSGRESYASNQAYDLLSVYRQLSEFDMLASQRKISVEYLPDSGNDNLFLSESVFVLYPLAFSKKDIVEAGESGRVFPYKTTRHVVPVRPMGVYFPIDLLKDGTIEQCDRKLEEIAKTSNIDIIQEDSWYEGRQYTERLAIFNRGP
jgi:hypothetical protein